MPADPRRVSWNRSCTALEGMKKTHKKLTLKAETVRLLSDRALRSVGGGYWYTNCPTSEMNETCSDVTTGTVNACEDLSVGCYTGGSC